MLVSDYVRKVQSFFLKYSDEEEAKRMKRLLKDKYSFLGITTARRKELFKIFFNTFPIPSYDDSKHIIRELFNLTEREYHYFGLELFLKHKKRWSPTDIVFIEGLILNKPYSDIVDFIALHIVSQFFEKYSNLMKPITESWNSSRSIWLKRTVIIFQLPYKEKINMELFSKYILDNASIDDEAIQESIAWALRDYSKIDHKWVLRFIIDNTLDPTTKRDAIKWMDAEGLIE